MPLPSGIPYRLPAVLSGLLVVLSAFALSKATAASTVTSIAPGSEGPTIAGMAIEDFEDVNLLPGFTVVFSVWRNASNTITAALPVSYTMTLPVTWTPADDGLGLNAWDGTRALVNGWNHNWAFPFAASVEFQFSPPLPAVGIGLGNFQRDAASGFTFHSLFVNGVDMGKLESLPGWVSIVNGKNRYLYVSGEPISSIRFTADTHFDGLAFDKLALADGTTPTNGTSWGRLKSLYR
jgi:hypothetical protein